LLADTTVDDLLARGSGGFVRVRSDGADALASILEADGATVRRCPDGTLEVTGSTTMRIGAAATGPRDHAAASFRHIDPRWRRPTWKITRDAVDYRTGAAPWPSERPT